MLDITQAKYIDKFQIAVTFSDGATGIFDAAPLLANRGSLLVPLRDPEFFRAFFIDAGALCWRHGLELSPTRVRAEIEGAGGLQVGQKVA